MKKKRNYVRQWWRELPDSYKWIIVISILGVFIRLWYIQITPYNVRQHDCSNVGMKAGHLAYIEYWYHNFKLPDFDPRTFWQFYHPPLHHIVAALWMKLLVWSGCSYMTAVESIQLLTVLYSIIATYFSLKIFQLLHIHGRGLVFAYAIVCLHPTMILMSGSINNDMMCLMFVILVIYETIQWYYKPGMKNICKVAVFQGLAMMAKTSGVLVAPAVAFIFIYVFIRAIMSRKKNVERNWQITIAGLCRQYGMFFMISVPLGMWWSVYAKLRFDMPIGYVAKLTENVPQYLGSYSNQMRFLDFNPTQLISVFENWGVPCFEHNIFIALLKTAMSGEYDFSANGLLLRTFFILLFYTNVVLVIASIIALVVLLFRRDENFKWPVTIFLIIVYSVIFGSYIRFCLKFPFTCTQDFRYIVPTMIIGAAAIGRLINKLELKGTKCTGIITKVIGSIVIVFGSSSFLGYFLLGIS